MNIGSIKQNDSGVFIGRVSTLTVAITIALREVRSVNPKAPKYEVLALNSASRSWVQVGALFELASNATGETFLNGKIDDPSLVQPLYVSAFRQDDGSYNIVWSRPTRRRAAMSRSRRSRTRMMAQTPVFRSTASASRPPNSPADPQPLDCARFPPGARGQTAGLVSLFGRSGPCFCSYDDRPAIAQLFGDGSIAQRAGLGSLASATIPSLDTREISLTMNTLRVCARCGRGYRREGCGRFAVNPRAVARGKSVFSLSSRDRTKPHRRRVTNGITRVEDGRSPQFSGAAPLCVLDRRQKIGSPACRRCPEPANVPDARAAVRSMKSHLSSKSGREISQMEGFMTKFTSFADLASVVAEAQADDHRSTLYGQAFCEPGELSQLSVIEAPETLDMPDPDQARAGVELIVQTMFDILRDTRLEPFAADLAWGFVNSFHVVAKRIEGREDDAADTLRDLARNYDPSEIYAVELEDTQLVCQTLQGCREAMECMRDHAGDVYRVETGRPFSPVRGSKVSSAHSASLVEARDYLAGRAAKRREQFAPEGPVVAFSGGQQWNDVDLIWRRLDAIRERVSAMVLATTAQSKGCDAVATAWAAARGVTVVQFRLDRSKGNRAAFVRNDKLLALKPVEAVVCEGSGIQANLAQKLRAAGVPLHILRLAEQASAATSHPN